MSALGVVGFVLSELVEHADLIQSVLDAARDGKLSRDELKKAVLDSIEAAYDVKVKVEMGLGT